MYVSAVSSFFNPYDVARVSGLRSNTEQTQSGTTQQQSAQTPQSERVIQGEVISRQPLQNPRFSNTNDTLGNRQFNQQQNAYGFNSRQAVNTYLGNQLRGEQIDHRAGVEVESLVDVYV